MKTKLKLATALLLLSTINSQLSTVFAQGTAFTYQGRLNTNGTFASGLFDLRFAVFDISGPQVGPTVTNTSVGVTNGLFTTLVDLGDSVFNERNQYLEIGVRPANTTGAFATLSPRQFLSSTPKANYAYNAGNLQGNPLLTGAPTFGAAGPPFYVNSTATVANLSADLLDGLDSSAFWKVGGNAGTGGASLGTLDNQPMKLASGNSRVLLLETKVVNLGFLQSITAVNVLGGANINTAADGVIGATIGGGGSSERDGFVITPHPNTVSYSFGTVGGGLGNTAGSPDGGFFNPSTGRAATVGGGENNGAFGDHSFVGGGSGNSAISPGSVVAGGANNSIAIAYNFLGGPQAFSSGSFIGSGENNSISPREEGPSPFSTFFDALHGVIGGGQGNIISGASYATIPGGSSNTVTGDFGLAAGRRAKANHTGAFVWGDSTDADFASTAANQFAIRASGGILLSDSTPNISFGTTTRQMLNLWGTQYGIGVQAATVYFRCDNAAPGFDGFIWYRGGVHNDNYVNAGGAGGGTEMMHLVASGLYVNGAIVLTSDRNAKENFAPVSPREVLDKVAALPISRWNYKEDKASEHLGPMAQDFYAAFKIGPDDKHIATVDADGVALAAIQGLNQKVEEKEARIRELENSVGELKELVGKLVSSKNGGEK